MNYIMKVVQLLFAKLTPKSTETKYYLDPKLLLFGTHTFNPKKLQDKISKDEFNEMRKEMIEVGGRWLKASKVFFILFLIYSPPCTILGLISTIYQIFFDSKFHVPTVINICCMLLPNLLFQIFCIFCMIKACQPLKVFLAEKNKNIYSARGVQWTGYNHLSYIRISLVDPEAAKSTENLEHVKPVELKKSASAAETVADAESPYQKTVESEDVEAQ